MMTELRVIRRGVTPLAPVRTARDAYRVLAPLARGLDREHFWRLDLDSRRRLLGCELVSIGSLDASFAHPREVFKGALLANAHSIVVAHNHPSQDTRPSEADIRLTAQLMLAGELLQIELRDHLILSDDGWSSVKTRKRPL